MTTYDSLLLTLPSLAAVVVLAWTLGTDRRRTARWTVPGWFLLAVGWAVSLYSAYSTLTGERSIHVNILGEENIQYGGTAALLLRLAGAMVIAISVLAIMFGVCLANQVAPAGLPALGLWSLGIVSNFLNGRPIFALDTATVGVAATGSVLLAATLLKPSRDAVLGPAVYGLTVAIVSSLIVLISPDTATRLCRTDKCGPLGVLVFGALGNENALGLALALTLPFVALAFSGIPRTFLVAYMAFMVWTTGSRSALIATIAVLAVLVVCLPSLTSVGWRGRLRLVACIALASGFVASLWIPLTTTDRSAYSWRGLVWMTAKEGLDGALLLGRGVDGWAALTASGEVGAAASYSTHNLWLDIIFTTGLIGTVVACWLVYLLFRDTSFWLLALPAVAITFLGISERPWTLTGLNWLVWVLPALILIRTERIRSREFVAERSVVAIERHSLIA